MSMPISSASRRTQVILTCFLIVPWLVIGIVTFDLSPEGWRFDHWPATLQGFSLFGCVLFGVVDALFAASYFLCLVAEAYVGEPDESG